MLQYFNTSWSEITKKMPELAEAGYSSLWLPPPTKGSGGLSVGYDMWDPFDLGNIEQRGSVRTRYGTEAELLEMVAVAHRFGIRIYFDNIMNHRAFDVPGYNENTPIDIYPGMLPEDFHLRRTQEGFYRKWDNTRDWSSTWQIQNLGLADLIDIAQEPGTTNFNHGESEGSSFPKIQFIRDRERPQQYDFDKDGTYIGFGGLLKKAQNLLQEEGINQPDPNQIQTRATQYLEENPERYKESVEQYLHRAARWLIDRTKADGLRLDAVKHVRADFFGATYGENKDSSDYGYLGQIQRQFNRTRGFSDVNHRDTVFDTGKPRDDAMIFGEHLGEPPGFGPYIDSGMRLVDNTLREQLNQRLGNPGVDLYGFDNPGWGSFESSVAVMHAQSHDNDYASRRELQHAMYFTRAGLGLLYTDGNHQAETLGESGGAFPRHANTAFLGQWDDQRVPNLLHIHNQFARGDQVGRWADEDVIIYERIDKREDNNMSDADAVTLLFMLNDNYANGQGRNFSTSFASNPGGPDSYLYNYSTYGGGFYKWASNIVNGSTIIPPGGYFAFGWKNPDPSGLWSELGGRPITILQNNIETDKVDVIRQDGPNGDPDYHGDALMTEHRPIIKNSDDNDFAYTATLPRITDGRNLDFIVRTDGSAENILLKLDGGIDLNNSRPASTNVGISNTDPANRDHPPALSWDMFLGYEQPTFNRRIHPELFAAKITGTRDVTGSFRAETFTKTLGQSTFTIIEGSGERYIDADTANFIYHDPDTTVTGDPSIAEKMYTQSGANIYLWTKTNNVGSGYRMYAYYTTDGSIPNGAAGSGLGTTSVVELNYQHSENNENWWKSVPIPRPSQGTVFRYKISIFKENAPSWFPGNAESVARKTKMLTQFSVQDFDATSVEYYPHNDYAKDLSDTPLTMIGLEEGFHILRARAFLKRDNQASIFNTFTQTFYYDTKRPQGEIRFPENDNNAINGSNYTVVVRTDSTVDEVWYRIEDSDLSNDDINTGGSNGNGIGFEPFIDSNQNNTRDADETFLDLNENDQWDTNIDAIWARAVEVVPNLSFQPSDSTYRKEWRFEYDNIPSSGNATIKVRLREVSSSSYPNFDRDDLSGHYTTLTRTVQTAGPEERMFIAYPSQDHQIVDDNYIMKAYFSKSLSEGLSEEELTERFLLRIGSTMAGDPGTAQSRGDYSILYDQTSEYHAFAFPLPNLYNDLPEYDHKISLQYNRPAPEVDLTSHRIVRAKPVQTPRILIVQPPEIGPDGRPHEIILPDIAEPEPKDRQAIIEVATNLDENEVELEFLYDQGTLLSDPETRVEGNSKYWKYIWSNIVEGDYILNAHIERNGIANSTRRNIRVRFRELVAENDDDSDDDGLLDNDENTPKLLPNQSPDENTPPPKPNPEQWINGEVHTHYAFGKSNPKSPDTDGDGLPDGLEVGWRTSLQPPTQSYTDTNGDGYNNFISDLDPPFYNTLDNFGRVPGVDSQSDGGDRSKLIAGSVTDPSNPDTDNDGLLDGIEDANRNGWVDGDGASIPSTFNPWLERSWPDSIQQPDEDWIETDPNNPDTDGDGLSDGFGEDTDFDGLIRGDINNNRQYDAEEAWEETDPLNHDSDSDGLPDGWETANGLDPLDNGFDNLATTEPNDPETYMDPSQPGSLQGRNGAQGDPDMDGFNNTTELANGTQPLLDDNLASPQGNSIVIGSGDNSSVGNADNQNEFTDWTIDDLLALDEYDGDGINNQGTDIYKAYDGFDSSRDIVAFCFRDGGTDGQLYFRIDFHDLHAFAEEGNLDAYIVIDTGNPLVGESALPDEIDTRTEMKWEAVVAVYQTDQGTVYIDTDPSNNTIVIGEDLFAKGVQQRTQANADGFKQVYFNASLDALELSISRQALIDAGWNGNPNSLNFQVFTTKDGTNNDGNGRGDIGGRSDIRDSIYDDFIASSYFRDQSRISGDKSILTSWFGRSSSNDRGKRAKVALLAHGNQPILPASETHQRINDGSGRGYYRLVDTHEAFNAPVNLHITPTLASALQWAVADPSVNKPWLDGPTLNRRISDLLSSGKSILFGTTFADQVIPFTSASFTQDSVNLANEVLSEIYGTTPSSSIFWPAERVVDDTVLSQIKLMGYDYTVVDQMRHFFKWFGRTQALGEDGYQINSVNGVDLLPIHDFASSFLFTNQDNGLNMPLREMLSRRARSENQSQIVCILSDFDNFLEDNNADGYDHNIRWLINRPWIELVSLEDVTEGNIDISQPPDNTGDIWDTVNQGNGKTLQRIAKDFIDHATQEDYGNWYNGQADREEGLENKIFNIRSGASLPDKFGTIGISGIANETWSKIEDINDPISGQSKLGRSAAHAAMFVTAFHNQTNNNLSKFSTGEYIYPDADFNNLAEFSSNAQSGLRHAAIYQRVDAWASNLPTSATASREDVDLDGEDEFLLFNGSSIAFFEAIGGRCVAAFTRNPNSGAIHQLIGTQPAYSNTKTEEEGEVNVVEGSVEAYRTSAFKDWFADGSAGGTSKYINEIYTVTKTDNNGWNFSSPDGHIVKTIHLDNVRPELQAYYSLPNPEVNKLYVRHGLSPNLWNLLTRGQSDLDDLVIDDKNQRLSLTNRGTDAPISIVIRYDANTSYQNEALDDAPENNIEWDAINMRNQALLQQVELTNREGQTNFTTQLALESGSTDNDGDQLPNWWERDHTLDQEDANGNNGAGGNPDEDSFNNIEEYILGLDPRTPNSNGWPQGLITRGMNSTYNVSFPVLLGRRYQIWYVDSLDSGTWRKAGPPIYANSNQDDYLWIDDGTHTTPRPEATTKRFYKIEISRP